MMWRAKFSVYFAPPPKKKSEKFLSALSVDKKDENVEKERYPKGMLVC